MVTIFTPTFNRAYRLTDLYNSLLSQTSTNFEWIIVDDCSTDNTEKLVQSWIQENKINIIYHKQNQNGGKHRAINKGVNFAHGDLFFIVDSDDFLTEDAVESIETEWSFCENKDRYAGLCFRKMTKDLSFFENNKSQYKILGKDFPEYKCSANSIDIAYKWGCNTDKAEIFKTNVLKKYPFPEIKGENFCEEVIVWFKIAKKKNGLLLCVNKGIYICEYLPDGLSANLGEKMKKSPLSTALFELTLLSIKYEWKKGNAPVHLKSALYFLYRYIFHKKV